MLNMFNDNFNCSMNIIEAFKAGVVRRQLSDSPFQILLLLD